jgi:hypothetical protein
MLVDMFLVFLVLVRDMLPVVLVLVLLLRPRGTFAFLLAVALVFLRGLLLWGMVLRVFENLFILTSICIMLTHMISWVYRLPVWPSIGFPSMCLLTLWDPRLGLFHLLVCGVDTRFENISSMILDLSSVRWSRKDGFPHRFEWHLKDFVYMYSEFSFSLCTHLYTCCMPCSCVMIVYKPW